MIVLLERESRRLVRQALGSLPNHYREVLVMRHYHDMTYEDIADILQCADRNCAFQNSSGTAYSAEEVGCAWILPHIEWEVRYMQCDKARRLIATQVEGPLARRKQEEIQVASHVLHRVC